MCVASGQRGRGGRGGQDDCLRACKPLGNTVSNLMFSFLVCKAIYLDERATVAVVIEGRVSVGVYLYVAERARKACVAGGRVRQV